MMVSDSHDVCLKATMQSNICPMWVPEGWSLYDVDNVMDRTLAVGKARAS